MEYIFDIHPKTDISGILPNNKRIQDPIRLHLNKAEFIKCVNAGDVYAVVNGERIFVSGRSYDEAIALFNTKNKPIEVKETIEENKIEVVEVKPEEKEEPVISEVENTEDPIEKVEEDKKETVETEEIKVEVNKLPENKHNDNRNQKNQYQSSSKKNNRNGSNNRR